MSLKIKEKQMKLPEKLKEAIENETSGQSQRNVTHARAELSDRYRQKQTKDREFITTDNHRNAYIAARMPATYTAVRSVLQEIQPRLSDPNLKSILDLGAGPGTVMWAACELFPSLEQITLFEKDSQLSSIGKRLAAHSENPKIRSASWQLNDLEALKTIPQHDLIALSYAIGELDPSIVPGLIEACWKATNKVLFVVEPGTPAGFERIRAIRSQLIALGSHMVAPCPHQLTCPMVGTDWCHFSERVERSSFHRRIKGGSLGYEDEKFSYVAVSKQPCKLPYARVLRHPVKRSGHLMLTLCTADEGLKVETVSKRYPEDYRLARNLEWNSPVEEKFNKN
jgi:ribosomal protein RSM22 (predicted rRNA methylase)